MKGKTSSGFEYELNEEALDDYELLEDLCEMDAGNMAKMSSVMTVSYTHLTLPTN